MTDKSLCDSSLTTVADAIAAGEVSSREVTEACLARIEAWQPKLNAFLSLNAERALAQARAADEALARGHAPGPLHGVPLAHKDLYYRAGVVTTCGARILRDYRPDVTASVLERLAAAGALHLGALNLAEFALGPTGHNEHFGHCRNPWNPLHITGGSSSGSGAAVAARLVYGALGSDTGGSIRLPAAYCGVVGIKPTATRVSRAGVMPLSQSLDCVGPLARTARDCARLLRAVAGFDERDPTSSRRSVPDYEATIERPVRARRLGILTGGYMFRYVSAQARACLEESWAVWRDQGCEIVEIPSPDFDAIALAASVVMRAESAAFHSRWLRERPQDYSTQVRSRLEPGLHVPAVSYLEALSLRARLLEEVCASVFTRCDALIAPVIATPAPTIAETDVQAPEAVAEHIMPISHCTRPINYLGLPSLALPIGFLGGLPYACQIIARPFAEGLLFNLAHAYQGATDWHTRAPALA